MTEYKVNITTPWLSAEKAQKKANKKLKQRLRKLRRLDDTLKLQCIDKTCKDRLWSDYDMEMTAKKMSRLIQKIDFFYLPANIQAKILDASADE